MVHCAVGRSRSASVVLAYLMLFCDISLVEGLALLRARRPIALPNIGFVAALVAMEDAHNKLKKDRSGSDSTATAALSPSSSPSSHGYCSIPDEVLQLHPTRQRKYNLDGSRLASDIWTDGLKKGLERATREGVHVSAEEVKAMLISGVARVPQH